MDDETESSKFSKINHKLNKKENFKYLLKFFIFLIITFILSDIIIDIKIFIFLLKSNVKIENMHIKLKNELNKKNIGEEEFRKNKTFQIGEFTEIINEEYRQKQNNFCKNINEFHNQEIENKIKLAKVIYNNITYMMFVYKKKDSVSKSIYSKNIWEKYATYNIINGLNFYSKKKNLFNKDIYIIDVGGNIGWYTFLLGKFGYNLITFEPSKINYYILNKNYCLNKEVNVTLINKGLFPEEKKCYIYSQKNNIGNGMINCNKKAEIFTVNHLNSYSPIIDKLQLYTFCKLSIISFL